MSTTTRRRSITKTHERISQLGWEPDYFQPADKYPSRYTFPTKAKDPMKHIMREYLPMELEKDERVYGGQDAAVRAEMTSKTGRRWMEIIKPYIVTTAYAEVGAGRCMSMLIDAIPNNELRNGYHVQFVDEIRHTGLQMALARWYAKHVPDPSGWHLGPSNALEGPRHPAGAQHAVALHRRRPGPVRLHADGRRRDGLHEHRVRRAARRRRAQRRLHAADDVPVRAVRRGAPHLQRLRDAADGPPGGRQRAADRARPRAGLVDQPRLPRRLRLGDHGVQLRRPLRPRELPGQVGALDRERLVPLLRAEARQARPELPRRDVRPRQVAARARHGPQEHAQLGGVLDAPLLAHRAAQRARLRVVRGEVPGLVRRVRRPRGRRSARPATTRSSSSTC